jgi:hypothetical protein
MHFSYYSFYYINLICILLLNQTHSKLAEQHPLALMTRRHTFGQQAIDLHHWNLNAPK